MEHTEMRYAEYKALKEEARAAADAKDWKRFDELDKRIDDARVIPEVGCPGSVHYYTDWCSGHVEKILSPRRILFVETGIYSGAKIFTKRKGGVWVEEGDQIRDGVRLVLGYVHDYRCEEI